MADSTSSDSTPAVNWLVRVCLENKLLVLMATLMVVGWGVAVAPFDYGLFGVPSDPVPVDAIPDIGENQQIVFTEWGGRSPQDVEDQVTYPLTTALLGVPGVKTIRSNSFLGFSSIYVVFQDDVDFYWARARLLEKLSSLTPGTLPDGVQPILGPDATALGQVYWYTVEAEGFDLHELRTIQDFTIRYALLSVDGVSEVASVGGYVREYQVDVDPDAMRVYGVTLSQVFEAVRRSNIDVGARTIEVNGVEYVIRGLGFIRGAEDLEKAVIESRDNVPVYVGNLARVTLGPALRRGALDKEGAEVVGGVVVARYGDNPLAVIERVRKKIREIAPGLPQRELADGTVSQVEIVPFYDRSTLIHETLGTLEEALTHEVLITIIVVIVMLAHLRGAMLVSGLLPVAVLGAFVLMKLVGVDSNIMSLSGIAIAIGTMVDMGIIITENIVRHLRKSPAGQATLTQVYRATSEVGGAVMTAISTTVVSFLPVFTMIGPEGKLFRPLAYTKTFALMASLAAALVLLPTAAYFLLPERRGDRGRWVTTGLGVVAAILLNRLGLGWMGLLLLLFVAYPWVAPRLPDGARRWCRRAGNLLAAIAIGVVLTRSWLPLGPGRGLLLNLLFVGLLIGGVLLALRGFILVFEPILRFFLRHKLAFTVLPLAVLLLGAAGWIGWDATFGFLPRMVDAVGADGGAIRRSWAWDALSRRFPGLGEEFMPPLDEGSFLLMPTTMPHASIGEALDQMQQMDRAVRGIPEVESVVGKLGRAESPLDPAPVSMFETVIRYKTEYRRDPITGRRVLDDDGQLIRQWRDEIRNPNDIWHEIAKAARLPGVTAAPRLQPIAARVVMLQTGLRAPMGLKIQGQSLEQIEDLGLEIERLLKEVPAISPETVVADRIVGKPYLEIDIDREAIARYGVNIRDVQDVIEIAVGGKAITYTVEGRERYPVRVRYPRELRDSIESLERILVPSPDGSQIPISQLAEIRFVRGPQMIKSEDTFLVGYVVFDKREGRAEVEVVREADDYLAGKLATGELVLPPGASFTFVGTYENQVRSAKTLAVVLPVALFLVFVILFLQFRAVTTTALVFSGILVAWAGGFILLWLYGQPWFMNFSLFDVDMRDLLRIDTVNLSVAVWVGFIALFGIASDNGVLMASTLDRRFRQRRIDSVAAIREATVAAARERVRPCLMTAATTLLALVPVLTSTGRGSDVMVPMAIPSFGGMVVVLISLFVVPVCYAAIAEWRLRLGGSVLRPQGEVLAEN